MPNNIHIGTSGWSYWGWIGNFYPEKIKPAEVLPFYSTMFKSVELNNSFYQIPKIETVRHWKEISPVDFVFACKANRYITHMKKLKDVEEALERMFKSFSTLEEKLGPILFQFPPSWAINLPRFENFLNLLPHSFLYTFEFRHMSWFVEPLYDLLRKRGHSLCFYDFKTYQSPEVVTGSFIYIRMHGPLINAYKGSYSDEKLMDCASKIKQWEKEGKSIYCYFDNDEKANAPKDALRLRGILTNPKA